MFQRRDLGKLVRERYSSLKFIVVFYVVVYTVVLHFFTFKANLHTQSYPRAMKFVSLKLHYIPIILEQKYGAVFIEIFSEWVIKMSTQHTEKWVSLNY